MSQKRNGFSFVTQTAIIQKSLVSHVQGDQTGIIIVLFENDYRLVV